MEIAKKKEFLSQYRAIKRQINRIEMYIEEIRESKTSVSIKYDDMPHAHNITDLSDYAAKVDTKLRELAELKDKKANLLDKIMDAVTGMEDEAEKDVIVYRYIREMSWEDIANNIGYSVKQTCRIHGRALEHIELGEDL